LIESDCACVCVCVFSGYQLIDPRLATSTVTAYFEDSAMAIPRLEELELMRSTIDNQSKEIVKLTKDLEKEKQENKQLKEKYEKGKTENVSVSSAS